MVQAAALDKSHCNALAAFDVAGDNAGDDRGVYWKYADRDDNGQP